MTRTRSHAKTRTRTLAPITPLPAVGRRSDRGQGTVRGARVMTAHARVVAGYYERADVQELVVTAILNELRRR